MFKGLWQSSWKLLNTNIISVGETIQGGVDTTKAVLDLSKAINENKTLPELTPLLGHLSSILDVLNLPIVQLAGSALPFVSIASKLLQFYLDSTKEDPSLEDCVELVGQAAYLESFKKFFSDDANKHLLEKLNKARASDRFQKQISQFSKSLTLTESEARTVLLCFHESKLADGLNPIVLERLVEAGIEEGLEKIIVERISRMTHREIKPALAEIKDKVKKLSVIYGSEWQRELETYYSIDEYLKDIAKEPSKPVFQETFGFKDIYVELQVEAIAKNNNYSEPQFIEEWALRLLHDDNKSGQVLFIQGEPGRGKSVFCRMFADLVRRELYPIWTPILIRLRDIDISADDFDTLLRNSVNTDFARNDNGWLTDRNTRFLFILDGFDELLLQRGRDRSLKDFLRRVSSFQNDCKNIKERGHRIVITGRPLALFGIEREMPSNLEQVKILDMSPEVRASWLKKWAVLKGDDAAQKFQAFISDGKCPQQVKTLAKEPLLLYLLAAMHGDNRFKIEDFHKAGNSAKILIYDATLDWVLTKQRKENLNPQLTGLDVEDIRDILKEAGLCVAQSGGECASLEVIEARLALDLRKALEDARKEQKKEPLPVALATFYLKAADGKNNSMEFLHKSFGEFLCAERLVDSLLAWSRQKTHPSRPNQKALEVEDKDLEWQVYDLLGFGSLTPEIVEYWTALIERKFKDKDDDFIRLFERLNQFYLDWSDGRFIEAIEIDGEVLPLKKARQINRQSQDVAIGQRKVDIYTGLNILILMFNLHRYAQEKSSLKDKVSFYTYKKTTENTELDAPRRLLHIIEYSQSIGDASFVKIVGQFLHNIDLVGITLVDTYLLGANLTQTDLSRAYFVGANLSRADLSHSKLCDANLSHTRLHRTKLNFANLSNADLLRADLSRAVLSNADLNHVVLSGADLNRTDLSRADLHNANLFRADLRRAYLICANLNGADLSYADLSDADLSGANLNGANLKNIVSNDCTTWSNAISLNKAINIPSELACNPKFKAVILLCNGADWVTNGDVDAAISAYTEAKNLNPSLKISAFFWNALGWYGSLHNRAADVLFACDKALEVESSDYLRDTRGLARALTGDLTGSIEDFEAAINSGQLEEEILENRQRWLEALKSGVNPFTPEELEALRASEGATSWT
jgi:uncharacterized protein YjbI with pentapeptide repeats